MLIFPICPAKQERHCGRWGRRRDEGRPKAPCQFRFCLSSTAGSSLSVLPDICRAVPLSHSLSPLALALPVNLLLQDKGIWRGGGHFVSGSILRAYLPHLTIHSSFRRMRAIEEVIFEETLEVPNKGRKFPTRFSLSYSSSLWGPMCGKLSEELMEEAASGCLGR